MNWSTRLRRWVRIRTPPVRVASMKPTAATVLPAPVACSNQKRRAAPGSSAASATASSSSSSAGSSSQSCGSSSGASSSGSSSSSSSSSPSTSPSPAGRLGLVDSAGRAGAVFGRRLLLGHQLGQGAGEGVDLVRVEFGAVAQLRRLVGEQPLEPEQQREVAAPLDRGLLRPLRRAPSARRRGRGGGRCRGRAPRAPRRRAGSGSRANAAARSMSAPEGTAADAATSLVLAMKACALSFPQRRGACRRET